MLCRARRASKALSTGGGGGVWTLIWVDPCAVKPRESVHVAVTVTGPGCRPAVFRVAEVPLPETEPAVDAQFATDTGTPSGLVQLPERFTVPPGTSSVGFADNDIVGGFFGGSGFTVKFAEQLASFAFFILGSVTWAV